MDHERGPGLREELRSFAHDTISTLLPFAKTCIVAAAMFGSGWIIRFLVGLQVDQESYHARAMNLLTDVGLSGSAVVTASCGAIILAWDAIKSAYTLLFPQNTGDRRRQRRRR